MTNRGYVCPMPNGYVRVLQARGDVWLWLTQFRVLHYLVDLRDEIGQSNGSRCGVYSKSDEVVTNEERPRMREAF
jgi:hypothetical protein